MHLLSCTQCAFGFAILSGAKITGRELRIDEDRATKAVIPSGVPIRKMDSVITKVNFALARKSDYIQPRLASNAPHDNWEVL